MLPLRMLGLLMFTFLLCDADSTCPAEINPLVLYPPVIIKQYDEQGFVNCSSTTEDHEGMYWREGNLVSELEEERDFIAHYLTRPRWDLTAECKIKVNETHECSKEPQITIYKNPAVVLSVKHVDATAEETQYELQCDIFQVAPVQYLIVSWYKNNQTMKTMSFNDTTKTPVNETSIVTVNISRGEDVVQVRCEAQLDFGTHGQQLPVISETHNVSAHYAPELNSTYDTYHISAFDGDDITLHCEAEGNPPPLIHWTCDGANISEDTSSLAIPRVNACATYTCTAGNYLGNITKQFHGLMTQSTTIASPAARPTPKAATPRACPLTLTPPEIVVRFGDPASVNCSTSDENALGMGWEVAVGGTGFESPPMVTWTVEHLEDWTLIPSCYITRRDGRQCFKHPVITLYKTPDMVSVSASDPGPMVEGTEYQLKCDINNVAPVQKLNVTWFRGNETVHTETFNGTSVTPVNVSSALKVTPERDYDGSLFICKAELHLGPNGPEFPPPASLGLYIAAVHYEPLIKACPGHHTAVEHEFTLDKLSCQADGNPPPTIRWYYQNKLINTSVPLDRTDSGEYTAEVVNYLGGRNTSVEITVEYRPSFNCNQHYEVELNDELLTKCKPDGLPTPKITWFKDGKDMVSPEHLTKHDSGEYLLIANNTHGGDEHRLYLDILYAPEFRKGDDRKEVNPGENVTLDCSAEGNPAPAIQWNFTSAVNTKETTVGRQKIITVTRATSTNAAVYVCVATNKVGSVTKSVTLAMKGKTRDFPVTVIWVLIILLAAFAVIMLVVFFHNRHKKHGQYTFVPNNANGSGIPLTTKSAGGDV